MSRLGLRANLRISPAASSASRRPPEALTPGGPASVELARGDRGGLRVGDGDGEEVAWLADGLRLGGLLVLEARLGGGESDDLALEGGGGFFVGTVTREAVPGGGLLPGVELVEEAGLGGCCLVAGGGLAVRETRAGGGKGTVSLGGVLAEVERPVQASARRQ